MSEPETSTDSHRGGFGTLIWILIALLVVYTLSIGPAAKLAEHGVVSGDTLDSVYAPLVWLAEHCPPVRLFLVWYLIDVWKWSILK